ncbi:MAG TPA: acyl-[ACP]--phospholipid O-acyltransferase, partial [Gammaproteobacteria bacterium]|nr:acyl-[ACP]--phospholipid O-acyltransferase [Gammaproteobacteria bacterium]
MIKSFLRWLLKRLYKIEVHGLENLQLAGDRVLVVANHTSFLDAPLLAVFLPGSLTFAISSRIADSRWLRPVLKLVTIFPMDPTNPLSTKSLIRYLQKNNRAVIFPEGRITVTGTLMKIYDGTGMIADKSDAMVLPVRIDGAQYTPFSRMRGRIRLRWFPKIKLTVLPPQKVHPPAEVRGRARRQQAGLQLSRIMTDMMFATSQYNSTLFETLMDARRIHGGDHIVMEDIERRPFSYNKLIMVSFILGKKLAQLTRAREYVGVLLPGTCTTMLTFMGLHTRGRVPAMLNYTAGARGIISACETAQLSRVITSRRFIELAKLDKVAEALSEKVQLIYLEDIGEKITALDKLAGAISGLFAQSSYRRNSAQATMNDPAVVLFTSGSEGTPKGVVLSHTNLLANRTQLSVCIDFSSRDTILNALPLFHSFGLTAGTLLPLLSGMKVFFYPSPLHYRIVPEIAYDINATVMFGTNTFLAGYARFAHPYDFYSVRYVFAGAEKLHEETRKVWSEKFGVRIFEGYGATETSPVLAVNSPIYNLPGSVGRLLPGIEYHLEDVPGVDNGGRLYVKGPNIMLGYLLNENPGVLVPPACELGEGWYDTGDIVDIDSDGFVHIRGRAKRFAKIAGEMVSLTAVEETVGQLWCDALHAVVALPDKQKGEQLVLVTEHKEAERSELLAFTRSKGIGELNVPRKFVPVAKLPLMGTGKTDYPAVQKLAEEVLAQ